MPNKIGAHVREIARQYTAAAVETLDKIMRDPKEQAIARIKAAEILLDRGYGKPHQSADVELTTHETGPRTIIVSAFDPSSGPAAPTYRPDGLPPTHRTSVIGNE